MILALIPMVVLVLAESPGRVGLGPYGAAVEAPIMPTSANPFRIAVAGLARGVRSVDFWLLFSTFAVCGFSTNGLVATHLIPYCMDHGIPEVSAAGLLAAMGVFDLIGTTLSGWLTDRYNARYPAVLVLRPARAFADGAAVHQFRPGQPVDLRGVLWSGLGGDGAADGER